MRTSTAEKKNGVRLPMESYLREINEVPLLTVAEEQELARRVQAGDSAAREQLIRANLRLVVNIARTYSHKGVDLQDLIEEGNLGLMRAAEAFDPDMNTRFSTYAAYWIRQSFKKLLVGMGKAVRLPMYMAQLVRDWRREAAHLELQLHRTPSPEEVAQALHLTPLRFNAVKKALAVYNARPQTGQMDYGPALEELVPVHTGGLQLAMERDLLQRVVELLGDLDRREATVLRLRFGLDDRNAKSLQEVGQLMGLTRERVRQIERNGLQRLHAMLE